MSRSRASAKCAGRVFELNVGRYIEYRTGRPVERRRLRGSKDAGDLTGVCTADGRAVAVECKNTARVNVAQWLREAEAEKVNAKAAAGAVVFKRRGVTDRDASKMGAHGVLVASESLYSIVRWQVPPFCGVKHSGKYAMNEWLDGAGGDPVQFELAHGGFAWLMTLETFARLLGAKEGGSDDR